MEKSQIIDELKKLVKLDIDAVEAYDQALKNIDVEEIHERISTFKNDHENHIENINNLLIDLKELPAIRSKDFKGFIIKGFTAIQSAFGTKQALKAMKKNEIVTNQTYQEALTKDFPFDIKSILETHFQDEKRHLEYIVNILQERYKD